MSAIGGHREMIGFEEQDMKHRVDFHGCERWPEGFPQEQES